MLVPSPVLNQEEAVNGKLPRTSPIATDAEGEETVPLERAAEAFRGSHSAMSRGGYGHGLSSTGFREVTETLHGGAMRETCVPADHVHHSARRTKAVRGTEPATHRSLDHWPSWLRIRRDRVAP